MIYEWPSFLLHHPHYHLYYHRQLPACYYAIYDEVSYVVALIGLIGPILLRKNVMPHQPTAKIDILYAACFSVRP